MQLLCSNTIINWSFDVHMITYNFQVIVMFLVCVILFGMLLNVDRYRQEHF